MTRAVRQTQLVGVAVDHVTELSVIDRILSTRAQGEGGTVFSVNLDILRLASSSTQIRELLARADIRIPDGLPVVWASRLAGEPLVGRVPGSSLVPELCRRASQSGKSVFLLGGNPGVADRAAGVLISQNPKLRIAGTHCPPFGFEKSDAELVAIRNTLAAARPDIVFVGLGFPKQEHLIEAVRDAVPNAWFVSCGITFSFIAGDLKRAPFFVQRAGLEWLHRFAQEPRRLFRRYFVHDLPFLLRLLWTAYRG